MPRLFVWKCRVIRVIFSCDIIETGLTAQGQSWLVFVWKYVVLYIKMAQ